MDNTQIDDAMVCGNLLVRSATGCNMVSVSAVLGEFYHDLSPQPVRQVKQVDYL